MPVFFIGASALHVMPRGGTAAGYGTFLVPLVAVALYQLDVRVTE